VTFVSLEIAYVGAATSTARRCNFDATEVDVTESRHVAVARK
jgi:hypothetical protein